MELVIKHIGELFNTINKTAWDAIQKIPQSGGDRVYFRIIQGEQSWIATYSLNIRESEFIKASNIMPLGLLIARRLMINSEGSLTSFLCFRSNHPR